MKYVCWISFISMPIDALKEYSLYHFMKFWHAHIGTAKLSSGLRI